MAAAMAHPREGRSVTPLNFKKDVCFVGLGTSAVLYYRVYLPAMALGADWAGLVGEPPQHRWLTGVARGSSQMPDFSSYKVVVLQQPVGKGWLETIKGLRAQGVKVVYEVDDYLHGIKWRDDHQHRKKYDNTYLSQAEAAMKACDALIASTEWIRGNYTSFNKRAYMCRNGLDLKRYAMTRPKRESINIGWAGSTGHIKTVIPWLQAVSAIMEMNPRVCFISIGERFATAFEDRFGKERAMTLPWMQVEQYPAAMTMFDIALAPGGQGGWWRGKSDLRWLEASALGIPTIANPEVYPEIEDGVTGLHATTRNEAFEKLLLLIGEEQLRDSIGARAKEYVSEHRAIEVMAEQWRETLSEIASLD
jgi:glycosyltransferase involved in cell wall biosynthesis